MEGQKSSREEYRLYRRQRLRNRLDRWRKMWKIYYGSRYGRIGFWILVVYLGLALASPLLTLHAPYGFIAPPEDAYAATQELGANLPYSVVSNGTLLAPSAAPLSAVGSYIVYTTTADGNVTAVGLGATPSTQKASILPILSPGWPAGSTIFPASVFALADYSAFQSSFSFSYSEYVVAGATHANVSEVEFAHIVWSGNNGPGSGTPSATGIDTLSIPGTLVDPPVSDSVPTTTLPSWGPFVQASAYATSGFTPGYIYTVTRVGSAYNLTEFYTQPFMQVWSVGLPGTGVPGTPQFFGSFFAPPSDSSHTAVLVSQGNSLFAFNPASGSLRWSTTLAAPIEPSVGVVIPFTYQIQTFSSSDLAFVGLAGNPGTVVAVNMSNGANFTITSVPGGVEGIATSLGLGVTGYPTNIGIVSPTTGYLLSTGDPVADSADAVSLPTSYGVYQSNPLYDLESNLMIFTTTSGFSIAINAALPADPIQWRLQPSPAPAAISAPLLIVNAANGGPAIAFVTSGSALDIFSTSGVDQNPLPPELHSPSGNVYLFGTNEVGQDVWSQWIASFVWDWEIGLVVAAGIMALSVLVAFFIGYVGNWVASVVEIVTLVLFLLPFLAFLIVVAAIVGPNYLDTLWVLTILSWPFIAITLIGVVRQIKARTFIEAARVSGAGTLQILRRHMMPNMTPLVAFFTALSIGGAVTAFSTLQFLGIASLTIPTWGGMLQPVLDDYFYAIRAPFWIWPPTIALTMFVFAFIFVSRGLDAVVNPRIRAR